MKITITLPPSEDKTIYDYTLGELLSMVETETGMELAELIADIDYSLTFLNGEKSFIFSDLLD